MKKRIISLTIIMVSLYLSTSCRKDIEPFLDSSAKHISIDKDLSVNLDIFELKQKLTIAKSPQLSKYEALNYARNLLKNQDEKVNSMRATNSIQELSLDYVINSMLRSSDKDDIRVVDTVLYIINIGKSGGSVLISGDKRTKKLLAVIENNHFNKETAYRNNNGFGVFLSALPCYFEKSIKDFNTRVELLKKRIGSERLRSIYFEQDPDKCIPNPDTGEIPKECYNGIDYPEDPFYLADIKYSDWREANKIEPLIPVIWGQSSPYNNDAVIKDKERCATGCVATAVAQILSYHKYPKRFEELEIDWDLITRVPSLRKKYDPIKYDYYFPVGSDYKYKTIEEYNRAVNNLSKLFRKIGDQLHNDWGLIRNNGTGAATKDIPKVLHDMGYSSPSTMIKFNDVAAIRSIKKRLPVILAGNLGWRVKKVRNFWGILSRGSDTKTVYTGGHAWTGDGLLSLERDVIRVYKGEVIYKDTESVDLIHCNWGWNGDYNGYFEPSIFDFKHDYHEDYFRSDPGIEFDSYFKFNMRIIPHIEP